MPRSIMNRHAALRRGIASLWLAFFAFMSGAVPIVDALVGHASDVVAHWEDADDRTCPPRHDASACSLCQAHLTARLASAQGVPVPPAVLFAARRPESAVLAVPLDGRSAGPTSRGPPLG